MRLAREERGLVGRMLVTFMLVILVLGVAAVDGGSILFTKFKASDAASAAAVAGAAQYESTHNTQQAQAAAIQAGHEQDSDARLTAFRVNPASGDVTVTMTKEASTLVIRRVGFLRKWGIVRATSTASPPTV
jgi:Flp pilus assembly protein TadG